MGDLGSLEIAGVHFIISCRDPVLLEEFPSIYQPFLNRTPSGSSSLTLRIRLELDDLPDTGKMTKVFDTDQSWSLYLDHDDYLMALNPAGLKGEATWVARFDRSFSKIAVYCGDRLIRETETGRKVLNPILYPLGQLLLIHVLAQNQGALIHAAGLELRGQGHVFPGCSGAGKSTLSRLLKGLENMELLSDDRIVIRKMGKTFQAYGTPWPGELGIAANKNVPLASIFFIRHGVEHAIKKISPLEALEKLMPVLSMPWYDRSLVMEMFTFCETLIATVPAYELSFKKDAGVRETFGEFVSR